MSDMRQWMVLTEGLFDDTPAEKAVREVDSLLDDRLGHMVVDTLSNKSSHPHRFDWPIDGDDIVVLEGIESSQKGKGYGKRMLNLLCRTCDKYGVKIYLDAHPYAEGLSYPALISFYRSAGFQPFPEMKNYAAYPMIRFPKTKPSPRKRKQPVAEGMLSESHERRKLTAYWTKRRETGGTITLYRVMGVREEWINNLRPGDNLGAHWSSRGDMHVHELPIRDVILLFKVKAPAESILVADTVGNMLTYPEESEVCLRQGTPVQLVSIFSLDDMRRDGLSYQKVRKVRADLTGKMFIVDGSAPSEPAKLASVNAAKAFWASYRNTPHD